MSATVPDVRDLDRAGVIAALTAAGWLMSDHISIGFGDYADPGSLGTSDFTSPPNTWQYADATGPDGTVSYQQPAQGAVLTDEQRTDYLYIEMWDFGGTAADVIIPAGGYITLTEWAAGPAPPPLPDGVTVSITPEAALPDYPTGPTFYDFPEISEGADVLVGLPLILRLYADHAFESDMLFSLVHPDTTEELAFSVGTSEGIGLGASADDMLWLEDGGANLNTTAAALDAWAYSLRGAFDPFGSFATFTGKPVDGVWQLKYEDDTPGDAGTLHKAELFVPFAATADAADVPIAIPDPLYDPWTGDVVFQDVTITIPVADDVTIQTIQLELYIAHPRVGELKMWLKHPDGTEVLVYERFSSGGEPPNIGSSGDHAILDNISAVFITDSEAEPPFTAEDGYRAAGDSMSVFADMPSLGDWTLRIRDGAAGDIGTVEFVALNFPAAVDVDLQSTIDSIEWEYVLFSGVLPDPVTFTISNAAGPVSVGHETSATGFSISLDSGSVTDFDATATASGISDSMAPGVYTGSITFTSGDDTLVIPVTLTVIDTGDGTGPQTGTGGGQAPVPGMVTSGLVSRKGRMEGVAP